MKILLFGEYSGLFNCLKDGFLSLGHEVFLASDGDSFKNYPSDYRYDLHFKGWKGNVISLVNVFAHLKRFTGFDIVLIISPNPLHKQLYSNKIIEFLMNQNGKVFLSGAGLNAISFDFWHKSENSKYFYYTKGYLDDAKKNNEKFSLSNNNKSKESELNILNKIHGYIPIMYEYAEPYRNHLNMLKTIPIPINTEKFHYKPNIIDKKIIFFHGLTRPCKGGEFIIKAFDILSQKYPNDAEFIYKGGLPFNDYIKLLERTNVVLDDVNGYSLGMNGLFSMAKGKIVMGGAEDVASKELEYNFCPAINLTRNVDQIISEIENVIENRNKIEEIGNKSRIFVETFHDHIKIAQEYLELFS
jgi:glycosyltransferase involved in cell wall biosynthesis